MRLKNAYQLERDLIAAAIELYHMAELSHMTSDDLQSTWMARIESRMEKLPRYRRERIRGYRDALDARLWCEQCEWRLGPVEGPIRTAGDEWTPEISNLCRQSGKLHGGHFWKGTDKPFTPYQVINAESVYGYAPAARPPQIK